MTARRAGAAVTLALRGDDDVVCRAAEAAGATVVDDADSDEVDGMVVVGEAAFLSLAADPPDVPVLPVDAELGRYSVPPERAEEAIEALGSERAARIEESTLDVTVDGQEAGRALADVTLMTSDPARISEYAIRVDGETVDSFRADGVVTATPLGSSGYARAAGGAVLGSGTGVSVVPVSPFATRWNAWVFQPPLSLSVQRDEGAISLFLDGDERRIVGPSESVRVDDGPSVSLWFVPEPDGQDWKNSNE